MKLIKEDITGYLKPKSKEEIENNFNEYIKQKTGYTLQYILNLVKKLNSLGVDAQCNIKKSTYVSDSPITIISYQIMQGNHVLINCPTEKMANKLIDEIYKNSCINDTTNEYNNLHVTKPSYSLGGYYTVEDALKILKKIRKNDSK